MDPSFELQKELAQLTLIRQIAEDERQAYHQTGAPALPRLAGEDEALAGAHDACLLQSGHVPDGAIAPQPFGTQQQALLILWTEQASR